MNDIAACRDACLHVQARKVKSSSPMGGKKNKVMCASLMAKRMKTMQELAEIKNQGLDVSEIKTRTVKCLTKLGKYISTILQDPPKQTSSPWTPPECLHRSQ